MSRLKLAGLAVAGLAVTLSAPVWGQFQEPTKDELQMTADAKAPGANAVYLYLEDVQDDGNNTRTYYDRVKILTEKGEKLATVRYSHSPNTKFEVEGRTIHKDGTIVPFTDQPADLVEFKAKGTQINSLVFTLPSAEVGCILEYRVKFKYSSYAPYPDWMIQRDIFVRRGHYSYQTAHNSYYGVSFSSRLGNDLKVADNKKGLYTLDVTDIVALPDEDWMPPANSYRWWVTFFFSDFASRDAYWEVAEKTWARFVLDFTEPTGILKKAVTEILSPGDTDTQKAQKIYAAVMKLENSDFTREKTKVERKKEKIKDIHKAQDVWRDQGGSGDEIALLYVALARAAGLNVLPMKVVDRSRAVFDEGLLWSGQMDDYIAVAQLDGKQIFLDPGEKLCPFGLLDWKHALSQGFLLNDKPSVPTATITSTPSVNYKASSIQRTADLTVDESGTLTGTVYIAFGGEEALYWRQLWLENDEIELRKQFNEWVKQHIPDGVNADFDHFLGVDDYNSMLVGTVRISGTLGTATGKRLFIPGLFFEAKSKPPFVAQDKRTLPVDLHFARSEEDDVTYRLPDGYRVESGPETKDISWAGRAVLKIKTTHEGNTVNVNRAFAFIYTILDPREYGALHDFYQKVAAADQQQIALEKNAPHTGGN